MNFKFQISNFKYPILLLVTSYLLLVTLPIPAYAVDSVNLADQYGFANNGSLGALLGKIEPVAFTIAAIGVTFYFAIAAFKWITSGGDKGALDGARNMMTHSVIGILMLLMLFLVLQYLPAAIGLGDSFKIIK
jgi:hypothetical protein